MDATAKQGACASQALRGSTRLSDNAEFILRPEGDPVDAQIVAESQTIDLQLTLAAPIWGSADGPQGNSGYQHHQIMSALNSSVVVVGYPPFRDENGIAMGTIDAITGKDRDAACRKGLASAPAKKALHDGHGCTLVVFAQEFYMQLLDASALGALVDTVLSEQSMSFDSVCVFDSHPGFFVERAPVRHASRAPESQLDAD
jgi:hypothetical protein